MVINHRGWASRPVRGFMGDADALLAAYIVWRYSQRRDELLYELQRLLAYAVDYQEQDRHAATRLVRHVRRCWQHAIFGKHEVAQAEFEKATAEFLRLSCCVLGKPAGKQFLGQQTSRLTGRKGGKAKAINEAKQIDAWHKRIKKKASQMVGSYSKTEALNILVRDFPGYGRRNLSKIIEDYFPKTPRVK
jgi:hypothetical protein